MASPAWESQFKKVEPVDRGFMKKIAELMRAGELDTARSQIESAIEDNPDFAYGHLLLGNVLFREQKLPEAIECYEQALEINPRLVPAPMMIGLVYRAQEEPESAQNAFEYAVELDEQFMPAHLQLGQTLMDLGNLDAAEERLHKVLEINPQHLAARMMLANLFARDKREPQAIELLETITRDNPYILSALQMLGSIQLRTGLNSDAKATFKQLQQLAPDRVGNRLSLGAALFAENDFNAAEKEFQEVVKQLPNLKIAQYQLVDTLIELERYQDAIALLQRLLMLSPRRNAVHQRFGVIYTRQGRFDFAVKEFAAALKHDTRLAESYPEIAGMLENASDPELAAKEVLKRLQEPAIVSEAQLESSDAQQMARALMHAAAKKSADKRQSGADG